MMDRRSQAMGDPIVAISPTMTIKTPIAGPMAEINPTRNAVLVRFAGRPFGQPGEQQRLDQRHHDGDGAERPDHRLVANSHNFLQRLHENRTPSKMISIK